MPRDVADRAISVELGERGAASFSVRRDFSSGSLGIGFRCAK
ncbi:MAG: hypothetical protein ACRELB_13870 [Polyangiaceae bacterium]